MIEIKVMYKAKTRFMDGKNQYDIDPLFGTSCSLTEPHLTSQADLSDYVPNPNSSKNQYELLVSR